MQNQPHPDDQKILPLPVGHIISEAQSQKNRLVEEVMHLLYALLPTEKQVLEMADGTKCYLRAFSPPKVRSDGNLAYGFDVILESHPAIDHLEFSVRCTGWGRSLIEG